MKEKKTRRWLSLLLTVVMVLSLLPATIVPAAAANETDDFYKIVHLDCGRKYFSPEWVKALIQEIKADGYTHLELAFGNDGLRFLLDDMSVTVGTTEYKSDDVKAGIQAGNKNYYNAGEKNEWTEAEMNGILAYAREVGIEIIPLLNTPGHMDAIVSALATLDVSGASYNGSVRTINLENSTAVSFTQNLVKKYAEYFKKNGCTIFNMGCDEYANDIYTTGSMGFGNLVSSGRYGNFVTYVNQLAAVIKDAGMTPMAFNDGFYFNGNTNSGTFDTDIIISFWTSGWGGYESASAQKLADTYDHKVINTHGDYYYVLGKNDAFDSGYTNAAGFSNEKFMGSTVRKPAGSMFCIWCDYPKAETETEVAQKVRLPLRAMALRMDDGSIDGMNTDVVANGFNADGSINNGNIGGGSSGGNTGDKGDVQTEDRTINVVAGKTVTDKIDGYNYANNSYETEDPSIAAVEVTGTTVDAKKTYTEVTSANFDANKQYLILNTRANKLLSVSGSQITNQYTYGLPLSESLSADSEQTWTITGSGSTYTIKNGNNYLQVGNQTASVSSTSADLTLSYNNSGYWTIAGAGQYYLNDFGGEGKVAAGWKDNTASTDSGSQWTIYEITSTDAEKSTTVTFTGVKEGTTYVTIGHVHYTIKVAAATSADVDPLTVEYWITNSKVQKSATNTDTSIEIAAAANVNSESGAKISELVPAAAVRADATGTNVVFWKATRLGSDHKQTATDGVDQTQAGTDFAYIRYWENTWSYSADGKTWTEVRDDDQIVAYYLQRTQVTDEVISDVVDYGPEYAKWSELGYLDAEYLLLDYSVKYESGSETPNTFPNSKSIGFHCQTSTKDTDGNTYRALGMIRAVDTANYETYMITVTPTSNDPTKKLAGSVAADNSSYKYEGTEKVIWAETQEVLDKSSLGTYTSISGKFTYTIGGEPVVSGLEVYQQQGMKVTYYVRAKQTADELHVYYLEKNTNKQFHNYTINVGEGTSFKSDIALVNGSLISNDVKNIQGKTEYVSTDLSTMLSVEPAYRYSSYQCVAMKCEDGKNLYLYYTFKNTHDIVIDFGLPVNIQSKDIGINGDWDEVHATKGQYGTTEIAVGSGLTYTPTKVLEGSDMITITLSKDGQTSTQTINVIPASNVLYEDNFLTVNTSKGKKYADWKTGPSEITAQQTADPNTLYGYDNAYVSSTGNSMESAWTITGLEEGEGSKYLTTTFNGTGFDLIGTSGPNTGYVYLVLQGPENRVVVIDTSYGEGTLYQVPLAHLDGLKAGTYTVNIRAAYRAAPVTSTAAGTNSIAAYSLQNAKADALNDVYEEVESMLPAGMDLDDCEFVYADSESPLAELDNSSVAAYALTADEVSTAAAVTRTAGTTVTIDGFRVYRDANNSAYTKSEQGVQYVNVMKAKINNDDGSFTAYVEGNKGSQWTQANYEANGGPQNEVYLGNGHAIAFKVNTNKPIQISARAVSGTAQLVVNGATMQELTSNTEMYYTVTPKDGVVAIRNDGDNMVALGNLKLPADTSTQALTAADEEIVLSLLSMDPAPAFAPKLSAAARSVKVIRNKLVTVTVHASTDVARLTINGKTVSPTNGLLVKRGWSKEYIYLFTDTVKRDVSKTYEIIAYNADGTASAPVQVTG